MGYAKINKRHAQESIMKKKKRSWTHEGPSILKKRERKRVGHMKVQAYKKKRRDSPCPKKEKWREIDHERSSYTIYTKIHTHAHLDQGL